MHEKSCHQRLLDKQRQQKRINERSRGAFCLIKLILLSYFADIVHGEGSSHHFDPGPCKSLLL